MSDALHGRVERMRERALVRAWEYRQRHGSNGVWYRLRRVLVDAAQAWVVDDRDADRLVSEGCIPLPVGQELAPAKRLFFVTCEHLGTACSRHRIPLRLGHDLLQAHNVALVAHANVSVEAGAGSRARPPASRQKDPRSEPATPQG